MAEPGPTTAGTGGSSRLFEQNTRDRATTAVVGKTLEAAIVVLFIALLSTTLHAGVAPAYERAAGEEMAERTLAAASEEIERATPPERDSVERHELEIERRIALPARIASAQYSIAADGRTLRLVHPRLDIEETTELAIPSAVETVSGTWQSESVTVLVIEDTGNDGDDLAIRLESR